VVDAKLFFILTKTGMTESELEEAQGQAEAESGVLSG
jgi:hypothetical protein